MKKILQSLRPQTVGAFLLATTLLVAATIQFLGTGLVWFDPNPVTPPEAAARGEVIRSVKYYSWAIIPLLVSLAVGLGCIFIPKRDAKVNKPFLWLFIIIALCASVLVVSLRGPYQPPLKLRLLSTTTDDTGAQSAFFSLSNPTTHPVVFLADATGLPYYHLTETLLLDRTKSLFLITNYNEKQFFTTKQATLPPGGNVTFPVYVPNGATGAVVRLNYLKQKAGLVGVIRAAYSRVRGSSSETYQNMDVRQPFAIDLKQ